MIYLFMADGTEETEAIAPYDIIKRAGLDIKTIAVNSRGDNIVNCSHGTRIVCDINESDAGDFSDADAVVFPGGMPGMENLYASDTVKRAALNVYNKRNLLAAICASPSILGRMGFLEEKKAICYPGFEGELKCATIEKENGTVRDGNIITSKGMGYAIEFGLEIVSYFCGKETAEKIKNSINGKG